MGICRNREVPHDWSISDLGPRETQTLLRESTAFLMKATYQLHMQYGIAAAVTVVLLPTLLVSYWPIEQVDMIGNRAGTWVRWDLLPAISTKPAILPIQADRKEVGTNIYESEIRYQSSS